MENEDLKTSMRSESLQALQTPGHITLSAEEMEKKDNECQGLHSNDTISEEDSCPWTFDGWSCFNATPADSIAVVACPDFVVGFDPKRFAHKECTSNGTWFHHPNTGEIWTNYTTCVDFSNLFLHQRVNRVFIVGYSLSLLALFISLIIFFSFKSLKCTRVNIHKNLFFSFLLNNCVWLLWHLLVAENTIVLRKNGVGCQVLHILCQYFMVSSYVWMFLEGLYLHTLLVITFLPEHKVIPNFIFIGWGAPFILTLIYGLFRGLDESARTLCWVEEGRYNLILHVPVVISMIINAFFLVNIVRVLVTKLRAVNAAPDTNSTKKAVRATLILIPLLGLHFILTPFIPPVWSPGYGAYLIGAAVATSFQGLAVSLLFCFFNGEVLSAMKNKWRRERMLRTPNSIPPSSYSMDSLNGIQTYLTKTSPRC